MSREKILVSMNLDTETVFALNAMKSQLGISKSAIVRLITIGAYEQFQRDRTLPSATHRQIGLAVTSEG